MDQLAPVDQYSWSHFCYSPLITRGSAGIVQLLTLLLLSTNNPWIQLAEYSCHTSVTLHSSPVDQLSEYSSHSTLHASPVDQLAEYSWSHFCYSPLITRGSAGRVQLVTHWVWQSTALHSSPVDQLSWSFSPLTAGAQLVTLLLLSTHHPWISWQSTAGQTSVPLHSSPVDQLAEYSWSHYCYSSLITRESAVRVQLVKLLLLTTHHPWVSWQSTAGHTSVTLHSPPVDQLAEHSWSHLDLHFCYSPLITRGSTGRAQLVTLLSLSTHLPWVSWQSSTGHTSITLHS